MLKHFQLVIEAVIADPTTTLAEAVASVRADLGGIL
jgi:hypothetical protein